MAKNRENLISCLTNERVEVRFLPRENAMAGNNPRHELSGGMANSSTRTYVVPQLKNGNLVDVLTKDEKAFLEDYLGLEDNALSVYRVENNFWKKFKVVLRKDSNILDLNNGTDYIKYKVLLANSNVIAPSIQAVQDKPKATYEYVLVREKEATNAAKARHSVRKEAYMELGKIDKDKYTMRVIIETLTRRPISNSESLDSMLVTIDDLIERDPKLFLKVAQDKYLPAKVLLRDAIEAGIVSNRGGQLYLREDNTPLCENGEPTLNVAAAYISLPKNSELKLLIESKVKQYKDKE